MDDDIRHMAIHEAGHAVIGRVLALPCGEATIEPDFDKGLAGYSDSGEFWSIDDEWMNRGKGRGGTQHAPIARMITLMAGVEAEIEILGKCEEGTDEQDQIDIWHMLNEFRGDEGRLRKMTKMLVRRHRHLIERVAGALLAEITIGGPDLDKLVGRSIDDVKPNMTAEERAQWFTLQRRAEKRLRE